MNRGPMPEALRTWTFRLFAFVVLVTVLPMCLTGPLLLSETTVLLDEYAPTQADYALAEEIEAAALAEGRQLDISPQQIAQARRAGKLDEVEIAANELTGGRLEANRPRTPAPRSRSRGAYYRDEPLQEAPSSGVTWEEVGLLVGGLALLAGAFGAAVMAMSPLRPKPRD